MALIREVSDNSAKLEKEAKQADEDGILTTYGRLESLRGRNKKGR